MNASAHTRRNHTARQISFTSGLCMTCASRLKDVKDTTRSNPTHAPETGLPQVRIGGRRYMLRPAAIDCGTCGYCGKRVTNIYVP